MIIKSSKYVGSIASMQGYFNDNKSEVLLLGRSNVGKSSFINTILNRKNIAYTSSKPGKTQTLNYYLINEEFYLVDAPGYGYAKVSKTARKKFGEMIEEYLINCNNLKVVCLLIDIRHGPTEDDMLMYEFLKYYNLNIMIIAVKSDKLSKSKLINQEKALKKLFDDNILIAFSSFNHYGVEEVLKTLDTYV